MSLKSTLTLSVFTLFISISFGQTDTIYFKADWSKSNKQSHDYYRVVDVNDSLIHIADYYKNGGKQMTGTLKNTKESLEAVMNGDETVEYEVGLFEYYNQSGSIYLSVDNDPNLEELLDPSIIGVVHPDSLSYEKTYYEKTGTVKEESLFTTESEYHGKVTTRSKKGEIVSTVEYNKDVLHGESIKYNGKGEVKSIKIYVNGVLQKPDKG